MAEESRSADVEKLLADEKAIEDRKQVLIADLLKQKETAIRDFDDRLAKLEYQANSSGSERSHHKKAAVAPAEPSKPKAKA